MHLHHAPLLTAMLYSDGGTEHSYARLKIATTNQTDKEGNDSARHVCGASPGRRGVAQGWGCHNNAEAGQRSPTAVILMEPRKEISGAKWSNTPHMLKRLPVEKS